jgi:hypothetical protein
MGGRRGILAVIAGLAAVAVRPCMLRAQPAAQSTRCVLAIALRTCATPRPRGIGDAARSRLSGG